MAAQQFSVSDVNPNDTAGGGGCACDDNMHQSDCKPPYIVFHDSTMDNPLSPYCVVCSMCAHKMVELLDTTPEGERLIAGNRGDREQMARQDEELVARRQRVESFAEPMLPVTPVVAAKGEIDLDEDEPPV